MKAAVVVRMKIAIVNDLAVACEALRRAVAEDPALEVIWIARDGLQALELAQRARPDLILMDLIMPRMNGAEATREIMRVAPCPILVVTATVTGNAGLVYEALGAGALDAVNTPSFTQGATLRGGEELLRRIHLVARTQHAAAAESVAIGRRTMPSPPPPSPPIARPSLVKSAAPQSPSSRAASSAGSLAPSDPSARTMCAIVAIGASTGGPRAVADVLRALPVDMTAATLIVQHVSTAFVRGFADWLGAETGRRVDLARAGQVVAAGDVLVAGEERHMVLGANGTIEYRDEPRALLHCPAIDELFASLAHYGRPGVAVLLTGMGRDGAQGMMQLRSAGWHTIAQDEKSSVVWGMPGAAHKLGAAVETLALDRIAPAILAQTR
jgi:two-component system response regulator WspF